MDDQLPDRVRIAGFEWKVTSPNHELHERLRYGETLYHAFEIHIDDSQPLQRQRETLLHELIHATSEQFLIGDNEVSEAQVRVIAHTMFQVMWDNPQVRDFIWSGSEQNPTKCSEGP